MSFRVEAKGFIGAATALEEFAREIQGRIIPSQFRLLGEQTVQEQKNIAPVDTGYMRDHISITNLSATNLEITSEADYSGFVEFGTRKMEAQPFFWGPIESVFKANFNRNTNRDALGLWRGLTSRYQNR